MTLFQLEQCAANNITADDVFEVRALRCGTSQSVKHNPLQDSGPRVRVACRISQLTALWNWMFSEVALTFIFAILQTYFVV